uniref:hypothetical protein n=1 Tax=Streptomyces caniscabiei TaxID=2746961 RepID=UPI0015C4ECD7
EGEGAVAEAYGESARSPGPPRGTAPAKPPALVISWSVRAVRWWARVWAESAATAPRVASVAISQKPTVR